MLKTRLIPALLLKNGRCVKTVRFRGGRDTGDPVKAAKVYDAQGADELLFLDITASREERDILFDIIRKVADECFMPLTVGGGLKTLNDIRRILYEGADKVAIGTAFLENPDFIRESCQTFGSSTIMGIINYKKVGSRHKVYGHGAEWESDWSVIPWAEKLERDGVGEILLYSIERDGTMTGYDMELIHQVSDATEVPLIVCGGAGNLDDFCEVVAKARVSGVSAGSLFHFTDQNLIKTRAHMKNMGLCVRSV